MYVCMYACSANRYINLHQTRPAYSLRLGRDFRKDKAPEKSAENKFRCQLLQLGNQPTTTPKLKFYRRMCYRNKARTPKTCPMFDSL